MGEQDKDNPDIWLPKSLTTDHKPESEAELARIEGAGGKVVEKSGVPRVVWNRPRIGKLIFEGPATFLRLCLLGIMCALNVAPCLRHKSKNFDASTRLKMNLSNLIDKKRKRKWKSRNDHLYALCIAHYLPTKLKEKSNNYSR